MSALAEEATAATALLTRLPVRVTADRGGAAAFGAVGAGLGFVAAAPVVLLGGVAPLAAGALAVALLALASGALHLDGLADTADALAAPTPEAAERARQDPHAGTVGVVALVAALLLDAALVAALAERAGAVVAGAAVVAAAATSRAAAALAPVAAAGRMRDGFGRWFAERTTPAAAAVADLTALAVAGALGFALGYLGLPVAAVAGSLAGAGVAIALATARDGLDGDGLGAVVELSFAAVLLVAVLAA